MNGNLLAAALVVLSALLSPATASAEPGVIKIGVIAELSGPFADLGKKIDDGIKLYLRRNGDSVAGKKVQVIVRNVPGPAPEVAKRLAQELVTQDGVDILAGFGLTPNALAAAAIATEAKKPMLIMNAAPRSSPASRRTWRGSRSPCRGSRRRSANGRQRTASRRSSPS